ncbi:MAG: Hint domain-containing protein [Paracoccaceae bacterium]|nr:Hint domain-containing protein [Paracoccaceae bacterium]
MTSDFPPLPPAAPASAPGYACQVFRADALFVKIGANLDDPIGEADDVCLGDIYHLEPDARAQRLFIGSAQGASRSTPVMQSIAQGSEVGSAGDGVALSARLTMMTNDGDTVELLILRHHPHDSVTAELYALPLSPMAPKTDYTLIRADANPGSARLSDILCVSFTRGTRIALADGRQIAIEDLMPGDRVLTRDHGPQPLRWIGRATMRAVGAFAPVVIAAGTLGNSGDLIVSQHHRMFLYQRNRSHRVKTSELLVQAKHLVDGENVFLREGGFVDYLSLVFDRHEIIYAEGICAESLMVNEATLSRLPEDMAEEVKARFPGLSQNQHFGTEAGRMVLDEIGTAAFYKNTRAG